MHNIGGIGYIQLSHAMSVGGLRCLIGCGLYKVKKNIDKLQTDLPVSLPKYLSYQLQTPSAPLSFFILSTPCQVTTSPWLESLNNSVIVLHFCKNNVCEENYK